MTVHRISGRDLIANKNKGVQEMRALMAAAGVRLGEPYDLLMDIRTNDWIIRQEEAA